MKLLVQPDDGLTEVLRAIERAKRSVQITIFRCDEPALELALEKAVERGARVHALIAHTNRSGEKRLRKLELRLLAAGVIVSRTNDDLLRYHNKLVVVDGTTLFVLGFNFTRLDLRSRSVGVVTRYRPAVSEVMKLFDADVTRQSFTSSAPDVVVSPVNARSRLATLIRAARKELLIYDMKLNDRAMVRLLQERVRSGVDVRIIGTVSDRGSALRRERLLGRRLHLRAILRDERELFVGSQSLRALELDHRRETGIIVRDAAAIRKFKALFLADWTDALEKRAVDEDTTDVEPEELDTAEAAGE